ncbi:MAG: ABC transporter permease [Clostridiales bacterium]|nr:ABC transporter permease [Clostridiales bacterium]
MKTFLRVVAICTFAFLYLPIILLIAASFNNGTNIAVFSGLTLHNYSELFADTDLIGLMLNSILVAVISTAAATVIGTAAAIGIFKMRVPVRKFILNVTNIPITNPDIVTGISLSLLFAFAGQLLKIESVLGFTTILLAHITFNLPYVILAVMPKLRQLNPSLNEAALDLGYTPVQAFFKAMLPEIMPGIVTGAMTAFTMSLDDFVISYFVSGSGFSTLPIEIYNYTKKPIPAKIYALFTVTFFCILAIMVLMNLLQARDEKRKNRAFETGPSV